VPAVARREDQHRRRAATGAPFAQNRQAIHPRQAQVEHDGVEGFAVAHEMRVDPVVGAVHHIARDAQAADELCVEGRLVFDDEDAHQ